MIDKILVHPALKLFEEGKPETEIIPKRTENTKTFYLGKKGKEYEFKVVVNTGLVHYKKGNKWEEIDLTLYKKNGKIVMDRASYRVEVFTDKIGYKCSFPDKSWFKMELVGKRGKIHYEGNQFFWDNVEDGIDVKLQLQAHKPEIFTQIRDEYTSKKFLWKITESKSFNYESYGGDMDKNNLEIVVTKGEKKGKTFFYEELWTGKVSRIFDKRTRIKKWEQNPIFPLVIASEPSYPAFIDPTITKTIPANVSDGYESQSFTQWKSSVIKMGGFTTPGRNLNGGFRFTSVNVPAGTTINSATLKIYTKSGGTARKMQVYGDKVANATAWSNTSRPSQITKTTAHTQWTPTLNAVNSINVKSQIASIIGVAGWASNNAMRFGVLNTLRTYTKTFAAYDHNTSVANAAKLVITYTATAAAVKQILTQLNQSVKRSSTY